MTPSPSYDEGAWRADSKCRNGAVEFIDRADDVIQRARWHEIGRALAMLVEPVDPSSWRVTSKEPIKQEVGERQGAPARPLTSHRRLDDVCLERLGHWPNTTRRQMV